MKRFLFLMFVVLLVGGIAYSQSDKTKKKKNLPQEKVTVNKEYDENGNIISFDSSYVYLWSSDTTMTDFPGNLDFSEFFNWKGSFFDNDSAFFVDPFGGFSNHEFENFFNHFSNIFPDSIDQDLYSYKNDSTIRFFGDSTNFFHLKKGDLNPDFHWQLNDSSMINFFSEPEFYFQGDSIWKKHQELLEKHFKDMEEFQKKFFQF